MSEYKHPEVLVSTDWVAQNLNSPGFALVEVDVDTSSYEKGHIPGAVAWTEWGNLVGAPIVNLNAASLQAVPACQSA
jgi:thiosulfate/3-mercaptopyruvate sulfurtransferase